MEEKECWIQVVQRCLGINCPQSIDVIQLMDIFGQGPKAELRTQSD